MENIVRKFTVPVFAVAALAVGLALIPNGNAAGVLIGRSGLDDALEAQEIVAWSAANAGAVPAQYAEDLARAQLVVGTIVDLGDDPTNQEKLDALGTVGTRAECRHPELQPPPVCYVTWTDSTIGAGDCENRAPCETMGGQLCGLLNGAILRGTNRDPPGDSCAAQCLKPTGPGKRRIVATLRIDCR